MSVGDASLGCIIGIEGDEPSAGALFVSMASDGNADLDTFLVQMTSRGRWDSERLESAEHDDQVTSVCYTLDRGSLPVGSPAVEVKLFCVAEFRRHDLAINYVLLNPRRHNLAAERLSEELTPLLQRLAELDPEIGA